VNPDPDEKRIGYSFERAFLDHTPPLYSPLRVLLGMLNSEEGY